MTFVPRRRNLTAANIVKRGAGIFCGVLFSFDPNRKVFEGVGGSFRENRGKKNCLRAFSFIPGLLIIGEQSELAN